MIPELGNFALILALCLALAQAIVPIAGAQLGRRDWMLLARPAATGQFVFIAVAIIVLLQAFLADDFTVRYVAMNSNRSLPDFYKFAALWGGHEGSLLLWIGFLSFWTLAVTVFSRNQPLEFSARVIGVLGIVSVGLMLFALLASNPFDRLAQPPVDGNDLNPLLQDFAMLIHPPTLYMGYVGVAVPFAFAVAALLSGRLDKDWARWTRPWTTGAWLFLTAGIALGSWWAYYELGWGGWWFWDPVENASFMPWLMTTALIHSLAVTEKRGIFKSWTVLIAIGAVALSLFGTFLTRSPILISVHAFAADPGLRPTLDAACSFWRCSALSSAARCCSTLRAPAEWKPRVASSSVRASRSCWPTTYCSLSRHSLCFLGRYIRYSLTGRSAKRFRSDRRISMWYSSCRCCQWSPCSGWECTQAGGACGLIRSEAI
jgi:cytochrome c-type biogenesis protein CcmF